MGAESGRTICPTNDSKIKEVDQVRAKQQSGYPEEMDSKTEIGIQEVIRKNV